MTDVISRNALLEQIVEQKFDWPTGYATGYNDAVRVIREKVWSAPALDVAHVVHARWIRNDLGNTRCSNCHTRLPFRHCYNEEDGYEWDDEIDETPWCMHCGARMDERVEKGE